MLSISYTATMITRAKWRFNYYRHKMEIKVNLLFMYDQVHLSIYFAQMVIIL